jgi:biuret amidohydrolase
VIFTRHVHHPQGTDLGIMGWWWPDNCVDGTPASEVVDELAPLPTETVIKKHRYSAFYNTDLETVLRCGGVSELVICGVMSNMCCESTARDAYFRDYRVFFPADANGTICDEMQVATLLNLAFGFARVTTVAELIEMIEA